MPKSTAAANAIINLIYRATAWANIADNSLIGFYDYGSDVTLTTGQTVTLDFDGSAGTLTIQ